MPYRIKGLARRKLGCVGREFIKLSSKWGAAAQPTVWRYNANMLKADSHASLLRSG
jgi:hypothetical protein